MGLGLWFFLLYFPILSNGDTSSSLIGITGHDFVLLAADTAFRRGGQVLVRDHDRIAKIGTHTMLATAGDGASSEQFVSYLSANLALADIVHGCPTSTRSVAYFTRREVHRLLRRSPVQADFLLAGLDAEMEETSVCESNFVETETIVASESDSKISRRMKPQLHWIDRTGASCELKYAAQGPSAPMVIATMDERWREDMNLQEALDLLGRCIEQLEGRVSVAAHGWRVKVVDRNGANQLLAFSKRKDKASSKLAPSNETP